MELQAHIIATARARFPQVEGSVPPAAGRHRQRSQPGRAGRGGARARPGLLQPLRVAQLPMAGLAGQPGACPATDGGMLTASNVAVQGTAGRCAHGSQLVDRPYGQGQALTAGRAHCSARHCSKTLKKTCSRPTLQEGQKLGAHLSCTAMLACSVCTDFDHMDAEPAPYVQTVITHSERLCCAQAAGDGRQIGSGRVSLVAPARYVPAPGSELTIDYGAKSNEQLLFLYGAPA